MGYLLFYSEPKTGLVRRLTTTGSMRTRPGCYSEHLIVNFQRWLVSIFKQTGNEKEEIHQLGKTAFIHHQILRSDIKTLKAYSVI